MPRNTVKVLIPDECENPLAYYTARSLKSAGDRFEIYLVTSSHRISNNNSWLNFYKNSWYIDRVIFSETTFGSEDFLADYLKAIADCNTDITFAASELGFKFISKFRREISAACKLIALPDEITLQTAFDKWEFAKFLKLHNLQTPKTFLFKDFKPQDINFPVLLKPIHGYGGKNIRKIHTLSELEANAQIEITTKNTYIVQEYINGFDIDCNVICQNGKVLAQTIQIPLGTEHKFSPKVDKLQFVHDPMVLDLVQRTMAGLKWNGVAHFDLRYSSETGELYVIEINPRFWQSLLGSLVIGVNFAYHLYLISIGKKVELVDYQDRYYAKTSRFIKDLLRGSLNCRLKDTNLKYLLTDPLATLFYGVDTLVKRQ